MAIKLDIGDLTVTSFQTSADQTISTLRPPEESWPAMCTCIGICAPTEDINCGGDGGTLMVGAAY